MDAGQVGELQTTLDRLQTTIDRLQRQRDAVNARLREAIESQPPASERFKRELSGQIQRRKLLPDVRLKSITERARG